MNLPTTAAVGQSRQIEPPPGPSGPPQKAEIPSVYRDFSTGPEAASRAAKKKGRQGQTCSPDCDRVSIQPWETADATAEIHRGARERGGLAAGGAGAAISDPNDWDR